MKLIRHAALAIAAAAATSSSAYAADQFYTQDEIASAFDIAFGAAVTSRYISRGYDQSDGVAFQGYIEPSYDMFYAGVWFSTVDGDLVGIDPRDDVEIDLYFGIRPEFGNLSLDIGYARYLYDTSGDCCGEIYAKATYAFTDALSAGAELYFDPENDTTYGVLNTEIGLPYDFTLSAAIGTWLDGSGEGADWNAGISYTFNDMVTVDARYYDSEFGPARFVATLSFDTSWSALRGN